MRDEKRSLLERAGIRRLSRTASGVFMAGVTPMIPMLFVLVPLKPWFPVLGPIKNAVFEVFDNLATSLFELFGVFFVGLMKPLLFIKPPGQIGALNAYYNSLIAAFIGLLLLGSAMYVVTIAIYPNAPKASIFRLGERTLAAIVALLAIRPLFNGAIIITNGVGRYLLGDSYSIEFLSAGFKELAMAGGAEVLSVFIFVIFGSISTLITVGLFYIVLAMRLLLIYVVYALLPLLLAFWIVDIGPMKYASQASSLMFKAVGVLLIFGILISGILAAGDAIGGESAAQQVEMLNGTNQSGGEFQTVGGSGSSQPNGSVRGGVFQQAASGPNVSEAGVMTKIFGYLGSMWLVVILTYSGMGIMISTGSTQRRHRGAGTGQHIGNQSGGSEYGGGGVVSETDDGGMVIQDPKTGRGVFMGEDGDTTMFGGDESPGGNGNTVGGQSGGGVAAGMASTAGGNGDGGDIESDDEFEYMSLTEKSSAAATKPRDWVGGGIEAVGSAAEHGGFDRAGDGLQRAGSGIKKHVTREGAATASYYGATFGGRFSVDDDSGPIHRTLGRGVGMAGRGAKGMGRFVKGSAKTYGKMFAEEDPVRATQIGLNAMRRSPIGDPRKSNVTGDFKEEFQPDFSGDEDEDPDGDDGRSSGDGATMGPFENDATYQQHGYEYGSTPSKSRHGASQIDRGPDSLTDLPDIGEKKVAALQEAGYESPQDIRAATTEDLTAVSGIGVITANHLKSEVGAATVEGGSVNDSTRTAIEATAFEARPRRESPEEIESTEEGASDFEDIYHTTSVSLAAQTKNTDIAESMHEHVAHGEFGRELNRTQFVPASIGENETGRFEALPGTDRGDIMHEHGHVLADTYGFARGDAGIATEREYEEQIDPVDNPSPFVSTDPSSSEHRLSQDNGEKVSDVPEEVEDLIEASNAGWERLQRQAQAGEDPAKHNVIDNYSATSASEFLSQTNEYMQMETEPDNDAFLRNNADVAQTYTEVFEPSDAIKEKMRDLRDDPSVDVPYE